MTPIEFHVASTSGQSGDWLLPVLLIWGVIWLFALATLLFREDFDPITKLTWVVVVVFVPFFGVVLYGIRPKPAPRKVDPSNALSGTPWENDPGYRAKGR